MKRKALVLGVVGLSCLWASVGWARVQITNASLSTQILLEAYRSSQNNLNSITWIDPNIIQLAVQSDAATAGQNLAFDIEIFDGSTQVVTIGHFRVVPKTLASGANLYNASDVNASNLQVNFNKDYLPNVNSGNISQGSIMPMGNYRLILRPVAPTPGDPYSMNVALFTPSSALNQPPVTIYPKDVEVNTFLPNFTWTPVANAAWYEVSVGPDSNLDVNTYWKSGRLTLTQTLYAPSARTLENGQKYYWQVRAFDSFGKPIGGIDGKSQPTMFTVVSSNHLNTLVSPLEVEAVLKTTVPNTNIFNPLAVYQPVAIETNCDDVAGLLRQLKDGSAKVLSARVE